MYVSLQKESKLQSRNKTGIYVQRLEMLYRWLIILDVSKYILIYQITLDISEGADSVERFNFIKHLTTEITVTMIAFG